MFWIARSYKERQNSFTGIFFRDFPAVEYKNTKKEIPTEGTHFRSPTPFTKATPETLGAPLLLAPLLSYQLFKPSQGAAVIVSLLFIYYYCLSGFSQDKPN